ncbi:hypothetical protein C4J95_1420 [Pseudomonas orientalis]|uniref:hypothetical protein n=1 Tax=Pseudomonas orientalis TaxID=76758 RepID=UPI000F5768BC|nr:hypothetical protein [Pseudomonas orientalis]AZE93544.1 hypothetical protein C4J96_1411 [Pseudomonas orientalis]AZE98897.1 hypothetical protein C4J95_1420 [Pseudomonas orientalis]
MGYSLKKKMMRAVPGVLVAAGMAVLLAACSSNPEDIGVDGYPNVDPPCTSAGYFKSVSPGWCYRCIYNTSINRWIKYPKQCPAGQEFNPATRKFE